MLESRRGDLRAQDMMIGLHPREPNHESLESMIFLFNWVIFRFQPLVFGGDCHFCLNVTKKTPPKTNDKFARENGRDHRFWLMC